MTPAHRPGAVGTCERCGAEVLRQYVSPFGEHIAILVYGTNRVACGGKIVPLWDGALGPMGV